MAAFRAASDLVTFLRANLTMANIAALSTRPLVQLAGVPDSGGDSDSGILEFENEIMKPVFLTPKWRNELYFIDAEYSYMGSSETTFKEMLEEFDLTLQTENLTVDRDYYYEFEYTWDTNVNVSVAMCKFVLTKESVDVTA